ncbi:MAG: DUF1836 domain-containing protein [Sarcina sp.]|nr:DUF1836 domain-containing protein [Sarcina sp.]
MNDQIQEIIQKTMQTYRDLPFLMPDDLPSLDLYMDQVTTLIEKKLAPTRRLPSDKLLTKTMINNYAKNKLLPPPEKKKYSQQHMLLLVLIYYFKNSLTMQDIKSILDSIPFDENVYKEVFAQSSDLLDVTRDSVDRFLSLSSEKFSETENQEKEQLQLFSLICDLLMDIYVKNRIVEQLIDAMC